MRSHTVRRTALLGSAALAGSLLLAPGTAPPAATARPLAAEAAASSCAITGGTLSWGVKESFRAYISGSIAHGSWETSDGAEYETPDFLWSNPTGEIDPETGDGSASFTGTIHFTGHDGILDLTLANPTIEFEGGEAALLLDSKSNDMEGNLAVDEQQQWAGDVALDGAIEIVDGKLDLEDQPVTLTNEGAKAFAGFYEAGIELDPLNLALELDGCESAAAAPEETTAPAPEPAPEQPQSVAAPQQSIPWLPIGIGGAALFVIGLTVGLLIGGRRPQRAPQPAPVAAEPPRADDSFDTLLGDKQ